MKAGQFLALAALTVIFALPLTTSAAADIFKCSVQGQTVYQDRPCAGAAVGVPYRKVAPVVDPGLSVPAYQPQPAAPGSSQLAKLQHDIRDASAYSRQLQRLYAADVKMTRLRVASLSRPEQQRAVEASKAKWQPQLQAAERRKQALVDEVRRLCPHGAILNAQSQLCAR
jgi:hypothetical protein